jgi:hypothetical protein
MYFDWPAKSHFLRFNKTRPRDRQADEQQSNIGSLAAARHPSEPIFDYTS